MFWKRFAFNFSKIYSGKRAQMSVFIQRLNPLSGNNDWMIQNDDYDYHQEVARSAFADMLHDTERNQLYEKALKVAIDKLHSMGKEAIVLDIGTGTGLLSMMAIKNGAESVTACEAFKPMSLCALNILELNGFKDKIKVIPKRSTELTVGIDGDLAQKCNILVTEVFDTELIGEGAISTFDHAHKHLLQEDCIVIPDNAVIYAQVVECPLAQNWNKLKDIYSDDLEILLKVPEFVQKCPGSAAVHDIQLSQLQMSAFNTIVPPTPVLKFDWSGKTPLVFEQSIQHSVKSTRDGLAQLVFMWWELQMDINGDHILSCAPFWAHPKSETKITTDIPWRDHWMQALYYLPREVSVKKDQKLNLMACHDEYSLWFNLTPDSATKDTHIPNPVCQCGLHVAFSRTRIGQINDTKRNKKFLRILEEHVNENSTILFLSDGFYYGLVASKLGAKQLYFLDTNFLSRKILQQFIDYNNIQNADILEKAEDLKNIDLSSVTVVFGEPYFSSSILPWDNLLFLYLSESVRTILNKSIKIFPGKCVIKAMAVQFEHLYKIREPLGTCEGFLMDNFDNLIMESSNISDDNVEPQPLWEYPAKALSKDVIIAEIDIINRHSSSMESSGSIDILCNLPCNGVALWVDWYLDDSAKGIITSGPTAPVVLGEKIQWDMYTKQGVCLFSGKLMKSVQYKFTFNIKEGNISFKCLEHLQI